MLGLDRIKSPLHHLGVDLVLFVGDFGNEVVDLGEGTIANLDLPLCRCLWQSRCLCILRRPGGRKKCPYDRRHEDWVDQQLDLLGKAHVGYGHRDFDPLQLSVVGGRPFSWGGPKWRYEDFYAERFGVADLAESTARITDAAGAAAHETVIFLSHNGPAGLGDQPEDPCGRDWKPIGGDFGDPDLAAAISTAKATGKTVPPRHLWSHAPYPPPHQGQAAAAALRGYRRYRLPQCRLCAPRRPDRARGSTQFLLGDPPRPPGPGGPARLAQRDPGDRRQRPSVLCSIPCR